MPLLSPLILGLIGGLIPGPILTAIFTEILQHSFVKSLRIIMIGLDTGDKAYFGTGKIMAMILANG